MQMQTDPVRATVLEVLMFLGLPDASPATIEYETFYYTAYGNFAESQCAVLCASCVRRNMSIHHKLGVSPGDTVAQVNRAFSGKGSFSFGRLFLQGEQRCMVCATNAQRPHRRTA